MRVSSAPETGAAESRFEFGKNWQSFVRTAFSEQRVRSAVAGLQRLLNSDHLTGKSFLDIGCGSGLSSLAALTLGAERVVAFDYDPNSVQASTTLREQAAISAQRWRITQGSILDDQFLGALESADVVYSWGVLHHTGAMWQAIDNAARLVKPGGLLAIALYDKVEGRLGSAMWWRIKRAYNRAAPPLRRLMEAAYVTHFVLRQAATLHNPVAYIRHYGDDDRGRGMDFWHDVRDWLGGFPYEYATPAEVFNHLHRKFALQLEYLSTGQACNEFTFRRR